ncbi:leucine-rich repeat domain-containing protein [Planctomicrobium piriforme]|uniref:Leucine Rich repeat-containing protein n=1 Tax=Planctomicrobium piriforme TaxID=1576369 RepID=A0A1I3T6I7_9PLAN|nr:hypothetical protein [Planctomicrobium piriforme]SFJ66684.1 hypothetical protein SAMN05421753_12810 [Planctomicrobium piriforme]
MDGPATTDELLQHSSEPPVREHRWRIRLAGIAGLILTVLVVVIGWHARESSSRNRLLQEIRDHGGSVGVSNYFTSDIFTDIDDQLARWTHKLVCLPKPLQSTSLKLEGLYFDNEWLKQAAPQLSNKSRTLHLTFFKANITDDGLVPLKGFSDLRSLTIDHCGLNGRGIASLSGHPSLQELHLLDRTIVDDATNEIGVFPVLEAVDLTTTSLTEDGLFWLTRQPGLRYLHLHGNLITPKSVATLNSLPLYYLRVDKVDDKVIKQLSALTIPVRLTLRVDQLTSASLPDFQRMTRVTYITLEEPSSTPRPPSLSTDELEELRRTGIDIRRRL